MPSSNKTFVFAKVPAGFPVPGEHITVEDRPIDLDNVPEGGLVVKSLYASFDPYQRSRMRPAEIKSYSPAYELGGAITNNIIAKVLKSGAEGFKEGEIIIHFGDIAEYGVIPKDVVSAPGRVRKIQNPFNLDLGVFVGQLGMPGLTAWSSLYKIGQPKKGETIFVSSAAGAVGQVVGQIAKHEGLRVIGSVGSDEKADFIVKELGFDGATNYKKESPADALKRLAPEGIDIYYENVGGETLEAAIDAMKDWGRIVACGMVSSILSLVRRRSVNSVANEAQQISQYNNKDQSERYGVRNLMNVISKRITMQGFIVGDAGLGPAYAQEHQEKMQKWLHDGSFKANIHYTNGIDNAPEGFLGLLRGENFGKAVLKIADA